MAPNPCAAIDFPTKPPFQACHYYLKGISNKSHGNEAIHQGSRIYTSRSTIFCKINNQRHNSLPAFTQTVLSFTLQAFIFLYIIYHVLFLSSVIIPNTSFICSSKPKEN